MTLDVHEYQLISPNTLSRQQLGEVGLTDVMITSLYWDQEKYRRRKTRERNHLRAGQPPMTM